jgi:hypothetical protein
MCWNQYSRRYLFSSKGLLCGYRPQRKHGPQTVARSTVTSSYVSPVSAIHCGQSLLDAKTLTQPLNNFSLCSGVALDKQAELLSTIRKHFPDIDIKRKRPLLYFYTRLERKSGEDLNIAGIVRDLAASTRILITDECADCL